MAKYAAFGTTLKKGAVAIAQVRDIDGPALPWGRSPERRTGGPQGGPRGARLRRERRRPRAQ